MKATITGIGVVGGFGCGVSALKMAAADNTVIPQKPFKVRTPDLQADISGKILLKRSTNNSECQELSMVRDTMDIMNKLNIVTPDDPLHSSIYA